jgi:hypothetical protein
VLTESRKIPGAQEIFVVSDALSLAENGYHGTIGMYRTNSLIER